MASYDERGRDQAARNLAPKAKGGKGQVATFTGVRGGLYNTQTQRKDATTPFSAVGSGIELFYSSKDIDGTAIKIGDQKFMLSPLDEDGLPIAPPQVGDKMAIASGIKSIVRCDPFNPAGIIIYYDLQLRG